MITNEQKITQYGEILEELGKSLDLTDKQIEEAESRYKAVGEYLQREGSTLVEFSPSIEPQGSFLYGTMIKPIHEDGQFDIDLLCILENLPSTDTQKQLKEGIGKELEVGRYEDMLDEEGDHCWTLNYAEGTRFHMDVLPSTPDLHRSEIYEGKVERSFYDHALRMTDRGSDSYESMNRREWPKTNPKGYSEWFKQQMKPEFERLLKEAEYKLEANIEDVPDWKVKTPLQRAIQILKRHRDMMYGEDELKPISIIITTLAAKAYRHESNVFEALRTILNNMQHYIEDEPKNGKIIKWVKNPVNPEENFADKWEHDNRLQDCFFEWLKSAKHEILEAIEEGNLGSVKSILEASFGKGIVKEAYSNAGVQTTALTRSASSLPVALHRETPSWPMNTIGNVSITGRYNHDNTWKQITESTVIPKHCRIMFAANTSVSSPYSVYWQVVNTGEEARSARGLRGNIFPSKTAGRGGLKQVERSLYKGTHWIECYIVQNGVCVAKSDEFIVKIG